MGFYKKVAAVVAAAIVVAISVPTMAGAVSKFQEVVVRNASNEPVPVTSTDDPGRHAFAFFKSESGATGDTSPSISFTVPTGKRLVIETVAVEATVPSGQKLILIAVQAHVNGDLQDHFIAPVFTGTGSLGDIYTGSQAVTLYADGGTDVTVFGARNASSGSISPFNVSVTGHLIDCTSGACD